MAFFDLKVSGDNQQARVSFYVGLIISALGCMYDLFNRRENELCVKNTKLYIMGAATAFTMIACLIGILCIAKDTSTVIPDIGLCFYFVLSFVAFFDVVVTWATQASWAAISKANLQI